MTQISAPAAVSSPAAAPSAIVPALSVRDLRKTYDNRVEALKGVSLDVMPGDFFALLGPNGAGKSTLIGIVSSLVNLSAGEVRIFGTDLVADRSAAMRLPRLSRLFWIFFRFSRRFSSISLCSRSWFRIGVRTALLQAVVSALQSE